MNDEDYSMGVTTQTPYDDACDHDRDIFVQAAIDKLGPRERRALEMRFGLNGHTPCTLREVGEELGVQRERARQIEGRALRKLRNPRIARLLEEVFVVGIREGC